MLGKTTARKYKDFGGNGYGSGRSLRADRAVFAVCPNCKDRHVVADWAWSRRTKPTCNRCGVLLEPGSTAQRDDPLLTTKYKPERKRRCLECSAFLRSGNTQDYCSVCQHKRRLRGELP